LRRLLPILAAVLVVVQVPARAQDFVYEVFGAYLDSLRDQAGIPALAVAIVDTERIVWERAYGWQDVSGGIEARTDTPFNADGLTQVFTAVMMLRCAEERRLTLDDRVGDSTIRQLLSHTTGAPGSLEFEFRPERLAPLWPVVRACTGNSYRETLANLLTSRFRMFTSVPGANIMTLGPRQEGIPHPDDAARYEAVLKRRALPYAVSGRGRVSSGRYSATGEVLTPASGLVTTVLDLANFDLELRNGAYLESETLAEAWSAPGDARGRGLPHGLGWFVQNYKGEKVVWQFGVGEDASSSLMITLPGRGLTLILMANSDRLVKPFSLEAGDVSLSPFARLFLSLLVR
jgi:CubicO group peptidase (beta-lactamase class C family)